MALPGSTVSASCKDELETELKFAFSANRAPMVVQFLERHCRPDPGFPYGIVSSIYFDTLDWDFVGEKFNSDYLKTKVRIRWYEHNESDSADDRSFLEMKRRIGSTRNKLRVPTPYRGADLAAMDLGDRRLLKIPLALLATGVQFRKPVFPAFIVRYERRRYIDRSTHARYAVDYSIGAPKVNRQMIATHVPCLLDRAVLEVKGTAGEFPLTLRNVFKLGLRRAAFSKYMECYRRLTGTLF